MDAVADFLSHLALERGASRHTVSAYRGDLTQLQGFLVERHVEIDDVSAADLEAFAGSLERAGLSPATRRRRLAAARSLLRHRSRIGARPVDVRAVVPLPRLPQRLPRVLSPEECTMLVEHPDATPLGLRDRAALELLYGAGLRVSELTGLRPGDLDLERGIVRVEGKGGRQRIVPTGREAVDASRRYLARGRPFLGKTQEPGAFLLNARGRRISRQGVFRLVRAHAAEAGIEQSVTPHVLRHSFATHMLESGADLRVVQELLGHASVATTEIYTHLGDGALRRAFEGAHPRARRDLGGG